MTNFQNIFVLKIKSELSFLQIIWFDTIRLTQHKTIKQRFKKYIAIMVYSNVNFLEFQWNIAPRKSGKLPKTTFVCQAGRKYIQNMAKILFSQNCKILQEIFIGGGIYWVQTYFTWSLRVFYCFFLVYEHRWALFEPFVETFCQNKDKIIYSTI